MFLGIAMQAEAIRPPSDGGPDSALDEKGQEQLKGYFCNGSRCSSSPRLHSSYE